MRTRLLPAALLFLALAPAAARADDASIAREARASAGGEPADASIAREARASAGGEPADAKDEAKLKERLDKLEKENEKLRAELAKANEDTRKLFDAATKAEKAAGFDFRRPTAVAAPALPATSPPAGQPASKHGVLRLKEAELELKISFGQPRAVRSYRVYDANCDVTRKGR